MTVKGQAEEDIKYVVKLIFENENIISLELAEMLNVDSIIQVGHSSELLTKDHYEILTNTNKPIQISGIDYIFFHHFENWFRIYNINYSYTSIELMIDVIINDHVFKTGSLTFLKTNSNWDIRKVNIEKGNMENIWNNPDLYYP